MDTNGHSSPAPLNLSLDDSGRLVYIDEQGNSHIDVHAVRSFPITDPMNGISVLTKEGKELAWISNLELLPNPSRSLVESTLHQRQFMPIIQQVLSISRTTEPNEWDVVTDRGPTRFLFRSEEDVLRLTGQKALIRDAHGVRYLILDMTALDARSRRLLERYL